MKRALLITFLCAFCSAELSATHNIAGEITYSCVNGNQYEILVTTYCNTATSTDRQELLVDFGDGPSQLVQRSNGSGTLLANYPNTKVNEYRVWHTYNPGTYDISISDPNRVYGIDNIPNSGSVPFYLQTTLTVDPNIGCNHGPQLTTIPLDKACIGECFYHNPVAVDADGDSLAYKIGPCLDTNGDPIPGYLLPDHPLMGGGNMDIDVNTGDLSWCVPMAPGKYNLVIYIEEWRRMVTGERIKIGTVLRDMSIDVLNQCNNDNPEIPDLPDLCVDAGTLVNFSFTVTDPDNDQVRLEGFGGPFNVIPTATLNPDSIYTSTPVTASFDWQTNCDRVRLQPWTVTFKATDDGGPNNSGVLLSDIETVNITVVSPGPASLSATPQGSNINLAWSQSPCTPATNPVMGYKIYRMQGPSNWNPLQCETGVPASTGFVLIATINGLTNTTFIDNNGGAGLIPGIEYCYRVHTYFLDGAESYASPEDCAELKRDVPIITNVDITSSGSAGTIDVRWVNPLANGFDFDTLLIPGPYELKILRTDNSFTTQSPALVGTFTALMFYQLPTLFQDVGLNTVGEPYTYRLDFYSNSALLGTSQSASSVFLATTPSDNQVLLTWQDTTPWANTSYTIFRFNASTSQWDSIGNTSFNSYVDAGLVNGVQYCYYVRSRGSYSNPTLPTPLFNRSQEKCATPIDLTPPCAPALTVNSDCINAINTLTWSNPNNMNCGTDDVVSYNIWYAPVEGQPLSVIATIQVSGDTTIIFGSMNSVAGCYAVTALDTFGNQSVFSNIFCVDNCPEYELPNVFTPNGDGINDFLIPFPYQYVESIDLKIFDRWGALVFETADPDIHWNGHDMTSGKLCTDGVYFYTCTVNEIRLQGIVPRKMSGFIHLFGKDVRGEH